MRTVVVYRNGKQLLRVPAEIRNGILRSIGDAILINADMIQPPHTKASVAAEIKAHRITPEIEAMGMRIGDNGNGLVVRWAEDVEREEQAKADAAYAALPKEVRAAQQERQAIDELYRRSDRALNHDTDGDNVSRGYRLQGEANRRLAAWRIQYPTAAKEERRATLLAQAEHEDHMACGALTYDADGWISPEEQRRRHDEFACKAATLRTTAAAIAKATA